MFEYIRGQLRHIYPTYVVVECAGIGYQIFMANPFSFELEMGKESLIYVYQSVKEDSMTLFGFKNLDEKNLFLKLINVSGIGPKIALSILATEDFSGLVKAIEQNDVVYLTKFPGVGKKTASQIILDLQGKMVLPEIANNLTNHKEATLNQVFIEVKDALLGLGYSDKEVKKVMPLLEKEKVETSAQALSIAFKLLLKK